MNGPARGGVLVLTALDLEYQAVRAHLGAVLDQDDLAERIRHLLDLLTAIDAPARPASRRPSASNPRCCSPKDGWPTCRAHGRRSATAGHLMSAFPRRTPCRSPA